MNDLFCGGRGRALFEEADLYSDLFSEARTKTAEHNIYERSKNNLAEKNGENQRKQKENEAKQGN